jgi:hypothetical protein
MAKKQPSKNGGEAVEKEPVSVTNPISIALADLTGLLAAADPADIPEGDVISFLPVVLGGLQKKREYHAEQVTSISTEITSSLAALGFENDEEEEEEDEQPKRARKVRTTARVGNRGRNEGLMSERLYKVAKKRGAKGGTLAILAQDMLDDGWETSADFDGFKKSLYISGIRKLVEDGKMVKFSNPAGGREPCYKAK